MFFLNNLRNTYHRILVIFLQFHTSLALNDACFTWDSPFWRSRVEFLTCFVSGRGKICGPLLLVHFSLHMASVRLRIHWFHFTGHGHRNIMEQPVEWLLEEKKKIERKFLSQTWVIILKHHNFNYFPLSFKKVLKKSVKTFVRFSHFPRYRNPLPENTRHGE